MDCQAVRSRLLEMYRNEVEAYDMFDLLTDMPRKGAENLLALSNEELESMLWSIQSESSNGKTAGALHDGVGWRCRVVIACCCAA